MCPAPCGRVGPLPCVMGLDESGMQPPFRAGRHWRRSLQECGSPCLVGPVVEPFPDLPDPGIFHLAKVGALREMPAHQTVGMPVQTTFPGVAGGRQVEVGLCSTSTISCRLLAEPHRLICGDLHIKLTRQPTMSTITTSLYH